MPVPCAEVKNEGHSKQSIPMADRNAHYIGRIEVGSFILEYDIEFLIPLLKLSTFLHTCRFWYRIM